MPRPLLPPKGVFIPTSMIYNPSLPPSLLQTWLQLRGLAWGRTVTPCLPFKEMAAILGKSPATLYRHMSQLRNLDALSWRTTGSGSLIVSFSQQAPHLPSIGIDGNISSTIPRESTSSSEEAHLPILNSQNRESPSHSVIPSGSPNFNLIPEEEPEIPESGHMLIDDFDNQVEGEFEGDRGGQVIGTLDHPACPDLELPGVEASTARQNQHSDAETLHAKPVAAYRLLVHLTPTPAQRRILVSQVTDLPLWQRTLEHWLGHGWNPRNLTGMLELYRRGGPEGCRYCHTGRLSTTPPETPLQHSLAALEALLQKPGPPPDESS